MVAGWDIRGPGLFLVQDDGSRLRGNIFSVGSGSPYAYGVLDSYYNFDMSVEEAIDLATRAIFHAGHRDAMSGGVINVYHVTAAGWTKVVDRKDVSEKYYEDLESRGLSNYGDELPKH